MNQDAKILTFQFKDAGEIPNNPRLPLVIYQHVLQPTGRDLAAAFEGLLPNGGWFTAWRYGVYPYPHYHSTAHEVLCVYRGTATLRLGHTTGTTLEVEAGDVLIIPAGVGHQNLGSSEDFHVVGGYPNGQDADLLQADVKERSAAIMKIARVPLPIGDPIYGKNGPLLQVWKARVYL